MAESSSATAGESGPSKGLISEGVDNRDGDKMKDAAHKIMLAGGFDLGLGRYRVGHRSARGQSKSRRGA